MSHCKSISNQRRSPTDSYSDIYADVEGSLQLTNTLLGGLNSAGHTYGIIADDLETYMLDLDAFGHAGWTVGSYPQSKTYLDRFYSAAGQYISPVNFNAEEAWSAANIFNLDNRAANIYSLQNEGMVFHSNNIVSQQLTANRYLDQPTYFSSQGCSAACIPDPSKWQTNIYGMSDGVAALQFNDVVNQHFVVDSCRGQLQHLSDGCWSVVGVSVHGKSTLSEVSVFSGPDQFAFQDVTGMHLTAQDYHDQHARLQVGSWSTASIANSERWLTNSTNLPDTAWELPVSEVMNRQPILYTQPDQGVCLSGVQINATIHDVSRAGDGIHHFSAPPNAFLGGDMREPRYTYGDDGLAVTIVSGMGQPITHEALLHANPFAPSQLGIKVAWTPVCTTWPAEPEQSQPPRALAAAQVLRAVVAGDRELPPTLPGADGLGILAAEILLAAFDDEPVTCPRLPALNHSRSARTICNCITEVNTLAETAGLQAIFKPTNRLVEAAMALPWLPAYNRSKFVEFLNWMYQAFYEGSGYAKRLREQLTDEECDPLWRLKHLRTWAHHDIEHGDLQEAARKKRLIAESFEMLIGKPQPEMREDFLRAQSELSKRIMSMMRLLRTYLQVRIIH